MENVAESSDQALADLLRKRGSLSVSELTAAMQVTATAVRQRLVRLMKQGMIERESTRAGRGRPSHRYRLTQKGRRQAGSNFPDLAFELWREIRGIQDRSIRQGMLHRIATTLSQIYGGRLAGDTPAERMEQLSELMSERDVPFSVDRSAELPVLTAVACPYPDLADEDRGVCAMEKMMFSELVGEPLRLSECRLDGGSCCRFEIN